MMSVLISPETQQIYKPSFASLTNSYQNNQTQFDLVESYFRGTAIRRQVLKQYIEKADGSVCSIVKFMSRTELNLDPDVAIDLLATMPLHVMSVLAQWIRTVGNVRDFVAYNFESELMILSLVKADNICRETRIAFLFKIGAIADNQDNKVISNLVSDAIESLDD
jgi:hypothetical protein